MMVCDIDGKNLTRGNVRKPFIHISFDDVESCIKHLSAGTLDSIYDDAFFEMLKTFHEEYGAVFSLYPDRTDTTGFFNLPAKYKSEFVSCSEWLKFGFHCYAVENLEDATESEATTRYNNFVAVVIEKANGINSLDRFPRLNNIEGNKNACIGLKKANAGIVGLLGASTIRDVYYLDSSQSQYLKESAIFYDTETGLAFLDTSLCLDWFMDGYSTQSEYDVPVEDNPYDEMVRRHSVSSYGKHFANLEVYGHETNIYSSSYVIDSDYKSFVEQICKFGDDYNYDFDFPQNRLLNITSLVLS